MNEDVKAPDVEKQGAFSSGPFVLSVASLTLTQFRNYSALRLDVDARPVVLTGTNGIGKTNILEALSLLAPGRGIRGARPQEFSHKGQDFPWAVSVKLKTREGIVSIGTGKDPLSESETRIIKINGQKERGQNALEQYASVLWLTPQMDQTLNESTTTRRQFLDKLTSLFFVEHTKQLNAYENAKSERKHLLYDRRADHAWISALEQRMAEHAVAIASARLETIHYLQAGIDASASPFPKANLAISGSVESALTYNKSGGNAMIAEGVLRDELMHSRELDRESGKTNFGTHRSDFLVHHREKDMPAYLCSTGEQKALLLSITLAAAHAKAARQNVVPLLLLDEVVAHLDEGRRAALFEEILSLKAQVWMTGTDPLFFEKIVPEAQCFSLPLQP